MRILVFIAVVFWCSSAFAQAGVNPSSEAADTLEQADQYYQNAVKLFGEGRYREALNEFDKAIAISPESIFYCNRAVVLIELGETAPALESFEACQRTYSGDDAEELAQIDAQRQAVVVVASVMKPSGQTVARAIVADSAPVAEVNSGWSLSSWGVLTLGFGGALLASAATIDFLSADLVDRYVAESEGRVGTSEERFESLRSEIETRQLVFYALTGAGGLLAVTGLTMIVLDTGDSSSTEIAINPLVSEGYTGAQLRVVW